MWGSRSRRLDLSPGLGTALAVLLYGAIAGAGVAVQRIARLDFLPLHPELGLFLALLLIWPVHPWRALIAALVISGLIVAAASPPPADLALLTALACTGSVAIAYVILAPRFRARPDPTRPGSLGLLLIVSGIAPFFPSLLAADGAYFLHRLPYLAFWLPRYTAAVNSLILFATPILAWPRPSTAPSPRPMQRRSALPPYTALFLTLAAELLLPQYPLRFLAFPSLILIAARRPFLETAFTVLGWSIFELGRAVFSGVAPFSAYGGFSLLERDVVTEILVFAFSAASLGFAASFSQMRRLQALHARSLQRLRESEERFRELAARSRDAIFRIGPDAKRIYVSPAVTELFGFTPEEQIGRDWRDDVHPADWPSVKPILRAFIQDEEDRTAFSYRRRCKDGSYVWVETRVRRVRDPRTGAVREFVANTRDISAQKAAEDELNAANARLAALAMSDGLTGIANRRAFDQALAQEWARAQRDGTPLALLVIDIDHFKSFNDFYGHLAGDDCLRTLAGILRSEVHRMSDLPARYGGEEFVLLLPGTDLVGAKVIAARIHARIAEAGLRNEIVPTGRLTVSIGIAAEEPGRRHDSAASLFAAADRALYAAKHWGRNQTVAEDDPRLATIEGEVPERPAPRETEPSLSGSWPSSPSSPITSPITRNGKAPSPFAKGGIEDLETGAGKEEDGAERNSEEEGEEKNGENGEADDTAPPRAPPRPAPFSPTRSPPAAVPR